ncbi:hypothetical protein SAY87_020167 [Trapa incisa]|uniref:F-box domain-containing protein n=1 Tax=Trapa incisa TaxID=236973 RepID=A0AAN7Q3C9_9MYRT|nr:hypothetical protein SAY87_020167 [Trapa incisa]
MSLPTSPSSSTTKETLTLIPGLPNDVGGLILSYVPYAHHARLKAICKAWRLFFSSKSLLSFRRRNSNCLSHLLCIFPTDPSIVSPYLFESRCLAWCPLPPLPPDPYAYGLCNFSSISVGPYLYVLGGSQFDTRSFPLDRPSPSSSAFRFDFFTNRWDRLSPMISPRGSFACTVVPGFDQILVAGGGSRHTMFGAAGSRMSSVERYDIEKDEWMALDGLPRFRAGCVGFLIGSGEQREFLVMGGYGQSRTVFGVFPVDEYYRDAVVLELSGNNSNGRGTWRELGNMWEEGERRKLGKTVVVEDEDGGGVPAIFMLEGSEIFRYHMASNRWLKESYLPRRTPPGSAHGFVVLDGELHVVSPLCAQDSAINRRSRTPKTAGNVLIQIYNPRRKLWRSLTTKLPFSNPLDLGSAVMCTIQI